MARENKPEPIVPVILAGGAGSRLWPLSRAHLPKQFIPGLGEAGASLFGAALRRVADDGLFTPPLILCNAAHEALLAGELRCAARAPDAILLEPGMRNTAPALAAAVHLLLRERGEAVLAMLPADHAISGEGGFAQALATAARIAAAGHLVLLGVAPVTPNPAYGYIRPGTRLNGLGEAFSVSEFIEKPGRDRAAALLAQGDCYWNSGIIVAEASLLAEDLARHAPHVWEAAGRALAAAERNEHGLHLDPRAWQAAPEISADHALLERTGRAAVCPARFGWSDLGSWEGIWSAPALAGADDRNARNVVLTGVPGLSMMRLSIRPGARTALGDVEWTPSRYLVTNAPARLLGRGRDMAVAANEPLLLPSGRWRLVPAKPGDLRALLLEYR